MENEKKKNICGIVLVVILVLIILGLVGFILVDKDVIKLKDSDVKEESSIKKENDSVDEKVTFEISYEEEEYKTEDATGKVLTTNVRNLPIIKSNKRQDVADKIVASLKVYSDKEWDNIKESADRVENMDRLGAKFILSTVKTTDSYISFLGTLSGCFGGVNWDDTYAYIYSTTTGEELKISDISKDSEKFDKYCYDYAVDYLIENYSVQYFHENWKEELSNTLYSSWNLDDEGIKFYIKRYSIAAGATDGIVVKIPYEDINQYLKDEYIG